MQGTQNVKAFTMIEIVIVVVILAIVAGLALPKIIGPSIEQASFSEAVHQLSALAAAENSYFLDHDSNYAGNCALLDVDLAFKGFDAPDCSAGGTAGKVSVQRKAGGSAGRYTVMVDATTTASAYSCDLGGSACPTYLSKLLP